MHLTTYILASAQAFEIAANVKNQAEKFGICLSIGLAFGVFALLYFRRSSWAETFVTDLFATLAVGAGFVICHQLVFVGKFELYALLAYSVGVAVIPILFRVAKKLIAKRKQAQKKV